MIWLIIGIWNGIVFFLYGMDKWKAKHRKWRISEAFLIGIAFCMGGMGALLGMLFFHHKTKKWKFRILIPLSVIAQTAVVYGIAS